jgi:hypothetical protein
MTACHVPRQQKMTSDYFDKRGERGNKNNIVEGRWSSETAPKLIQRKATRCRHGVIEGKAVQGVES